MPLVCRTDDARDGRIASPDDGVGSELAFAQATDGKVDHLQDGRQNVGAGLHYGLGLLRCSLPGENALSAAPSSGHYTLLARPTLSGASGKLLGAFGVGAYRGIVPIWGGA